MVRDKGAGGVWKPTGGRYPERRWREVTFVTASEDKIRTLEGIAGSVRDHAWPSCARQRRGCRGRGRKAVLSCLYFVSGLQPGPRSGSPAITPVVFPSANS